MNDRNTGFSDKIIKKCNRYGTTPEALLQARSTGISVSKLSRDLDIPRTSLTSILNEIEDGNGKRTWGTESKIDKDWLYGEYVVKGRSIDDIAAELEVGRNVIWRANKRYGYGEMRKQYEKEQSAADAINVDVEWLKREIADNGRDHKEIAEELGTSINAVKKACSESGIRKKCTSIKYRSENASRFAADVELYREGLENGSIMKSSLAKEYDISNKTVAKICKQAGVKFPERVSSIFDSYGITIEWLTEQCAKGKTLNRIANKVGCTRGAIEKACKIHGIEYSSGKASLKTLGVTLEWLANEHLIKRRSCKDIADDLGKNDDVIERLCSREQVQTPLQYVCRIGGITEGILFNKIDVEHAELDDLAEELKVDRRILLRVFLEYDENGRIGKYDCRKWGINAEWLYKERVGKKRSPKSLSDELRVPYKIIKKILDANDLYDRAFSLAEKFGLTDEWFAEQRANGVSQRQLERDLKSIMSRATIRRIYQSIDKDAGWISLKPFGKNRLRVFEEFGGCVKIEEPNAAQHPISPARKHNVTPEWLREQYIKLERDIQDIADELGVSASTCRNILSDSKVSRRSLTVCEKYNIDPKWLAEQRFNNRSYADLARQLGTRSEIIKDACYQEKIDSFDIDGFVDAHGTSISEITQMRVEQNMSIEAIAKVFKADRCNVKRLCWALDLPSPNDKSAAERNGISYADVIQAVDAQGANLFNISKKLGVSMRTAEKIIIEFGLDVPHARAHSIKENEWESFLRKTK